NIRNVQADLYLQRTAHAESVETMVGHVRDMGDTVDTCFTCHHAENVMRQLQDTKNQIDQFGHALSRVLTLQANARRIREEQEEAYYLGEMLTMEIDAMITMTAKRLEAQTVEAQKKARRSRALLIALVAATPLLVMVVAIAAIRGVTRPILILLDATRRLKAGNLDHRIEGLQDEFGELAIGFNAMSDSLRAQMLKIEENERRYRLLFESAGDSIFILGTEGANACRILEANEAAARNHGYTIEELKTMKITDLDTEPTASCAPVRIERVLKGEWLKTEGEHRKKDGTVYPIEISAGVFEYMNHKYILAIDRDITERKETEEKLQRAEQIRVAGELATGLAHEIKNPLAGIKVSIEALSSESYLPEEDRGILVKVIDEIKRIELLMKDLLNFARPPRSQLVETNVNAVLDAVVGLALQNHHSSKGKSGTIALQKEFDGLLPVITADPMQLKQVFMNLIMNAVDAMPAGGALAMKTCYDATAQAVRIEISDTGKGIDAAMTDKIFQPFFTTKAKGTGLGLAISKRLVEDHGGKIGIERNAGGGATFKISLPVTRTEGVHTA
ncbi:MAG TPA: ATP-binding protein, partial [Nitrospirota bacterium]